MLRLEKQKMGRKSLAVYGIFPIKMQVEKWI